MVLNPKERALCYLWSLPEFDTAKKHFFTIGYVLDFYGVAIKAEEINGSRFFSYTLTTGSGRTYTTYREWNTGTEQRPATPPPLFVKNLFIGAEEWELVAPSTTDARELEELKRLSEQGKKPPLKTTTCFICDDFFSALKWILNGQPAMAINYLSIEAFIGILKRTTIKKILILDLQDAGERAELEAGLKGLNVSFFNRGELWKKEKKLNA